ncbi:hypothetical protein M3Y98_01169800 [Aphelenchoides besseyi]|nr:hypothetical protein M3Y98_01169800 [Aphelenchoides besseyi]
MDGSSSSGRAKRRASAGVSKAIAAVRPSVAKKPPSQPKQEEQSEVDAVEFKPDFPLDDNESALPQTEETVPAKRVRKPTAKAKKSTTSKLPNEAQETPATPKKEPKESLEPNTSNNINSQPRDPKNSSNEQASMIQKFCRKFMNADVKPKQRTSKATASPAPVIKESTEESANTTVETSGADLSTRTSPLKSSPPPVKLEPELSEATPKTDGRKRRLASFGVSKAVAAVADCQPKNKIGRPPNSAAKKSTCNSLSSHDQSTLADTFESPTAPAAKRLKLECQPSTSKTEDRLTASFQPLQISTSEQPPMTPFAPPPTPFTPSPAVFSNYGPQQLEHALYAQQQVYQECEQKNQARRLSTGSGLGLSTNRPNRHKSRPLCEFAPELVKNRVSAEERRQQAIQKEWKRQEIAAKRQEIERIREFKREQREARREQAVVEKLLRKQSAASAAASIDFSSTHEDSLSPASRRLGRPLTVSIDSDPFAASFAAGRRDSRSVSSPAITGRRYAAYGTQQTESAAPVSSSTARQFYERMERRRLQNPLARGLVRSKRNEDDDYFYREVIVRNQTKANESTSENANEEEEIDVLGDDDFDKAPTIDKFVVAMKNEEADEILVKNPADECVADVRSVLPIDPPQISEEQSEEEQEAEEKSAVSPIDRIAVEVELLKSPLLKSHLRVLIPGIINQRATDLCTLGIVGGCSVFYSRTLANATRLRQRLILFSLDRLLAMEEAHAFLLYRLPDEFLASYFNLLRFLRISGSSLPTHLVDNTRDPSVRKANDFIRDFVNTKVVDPNLRFGRGISDITALPNVSLVLVYPQVAMEGQTVNKHAHENMFRNLLPAAIGCVEKVELRFDLVTDIRSLAHLCLDRVRQSVKELVRRRPDDFVFLAGWGISTLINMHALQKVAGVAGVLNFAYPLRGPLGMRGTVDDATCITYCPSLFVVGDSASNVNLKDLQAMRKNMICDTGLVVVGGADDHLYVPPVFLSVERVSQHSVDRMILDHVVDFIKQVISEGGMSAREKRQYLVPIKLPNPFDVDLNTLKGRASGMVQKFRQPAKPTNPIISKGNRENVPTNKSGLSTPTSTDQSPLPATPDTSGANRPLPISTSSRQSISSPSASLLKPATPGNSTPSSTAPTSAAPLLTGMSTSRLKQTDDARNSFNSILNRRSTVAVCMHEPKNPMSLSSPFTTVAPSIRPPQLPSTSGQRTASGISVVEQQMRAEAEAAVASLGSAFEQQPESEEMDDSAF